MKKYLIITLVSAGLLLLVYMACTNNNALFDPTGETGITVSAFVCDTTGLDISLSNPDSLPFTVYTSLSPVLTGQTISFLGFIENDSGVSGLSWSWDFGDGNAVDARITEHKYLDAGNYNAFFTAANIFQYGQAGMVQKRGKCLTLSNDVLLLIPLYFLPVILAIA